MIIWWYLTTAPDGSNQQHSVSREQLISLLQSGQLTRQTLVWCEGMENWQPVQDIAALAPHLANLPPQIPPAAHASNSTAAASQTAVKYAGRWRRFIARMLDICWEVALVFSLFSFFILNFVNTQNLKNPGSVIAFTLSAFLLPAFSIIIVDGACYWLFNKTPGKCIMGIAVTHKTGEPVDKITYLKRNVRVYIFGLGCCLSWISFIAMIIQSIHVAEDGHTRYDEKHNLEVRVTKPMNIIVIVFIICALILALLAYIIQPEKSPKSPLTWTNPMTHKTATISRAWQVENDPDNNQISFDSRFGSVSINRFACKSLQNGILHIQIVNDPGEVKAGDIYLNFITSEHLKFLGHHVWQSGGFIGYKGKSERYFQQTRILRSYGYCWLLISTDEKRQQKIEENAEIETLNLQIMKTLISNNSR